MKINLTKKQSFSIVAIIVIGLVLGSLILMADKAKPAGDAHGERHSEKHTDARQTEGKAGDEHGHHKGHEEAQAKGQHGGKLFANGDFGLEFVLAKDSGDARFRVYLFS